MKLVGSMLVRDELGRYLRDTVSHALSYCDELRVLDDGSTDGSFGWLEAQERVVVRRSSSRFFEHEGRVRQELLEWTLDAYPTHVVAIDADELIPQGKLLRAALADESRPAGLAPAWLLSMLELWRLDPPVLRVDGGWSPTLTSCVYRAPASRRAGELDPQWRIRDVPLACGREPVAVVNAVAEMRAPRLPIEVLHLGWANPAEREARWRRYAEHDGGRFHADWHLQSIMWPDERCALVPYTGELPLAARAV